MSQMSAAQKGAAFLNSSRVFTDRGNSSQSTKPPADPRARRKIPVDGARHPFDVAGEDAPDMAQVLVIATGPQEFRRCTLHISKPKGGKKKAFDIPLSREMVLCLNRAIRFGRKMYPLQALRWIFPADTRGSVGPLHRETHHLGCPVFL